jgi:hypothetical protein
VVHQPADEPALIPSGPRRWIIGWHGLDHLISGEAPQLRACLSACPSDPQTDRTRFYETGVRRNAGDRGWIPNPVTVRPHLDAPMNICGLHGYSGLQGLANLRLLPVALPDGRCHLQVHALFAARSLQFIDSPQTVATGADVFVLSLPTPSMPIKGMTAPPLG